MNNIIGLIYLLYFFYHTFRQIRNNYVMSKLKYVCPSVRFSSAMFDSFWPHGLQHARPPCPSPTPGVYSNSCPLSPWYHPTISSSVVPFSSCLNLSQHQGLFKCQFFASGAQSIGVSASASVLPTNIQDWFPLRLTVPRLPKKSQRFNLGKPLERTRFAFG